ncbi:uncharacterized protein F4822DRAFT_252480 [Hypoxylon trugodes]|uniref:uncharacterized protein n=1 Tax=Hypoxylon trugodes TaxID=326681 RepID=UPI00218CECCC|nr:uncharacterized protein F4822DRAFT_252480 [Hypoxylon trugodes]KAI1388647.1 hypothetical protein F4822DRAFT_252480 [Hypoxylon trugodes]
MSRRLNSNAPSHLSRRTKSDQSDDDAAVPSLPPSSPPSDQESSPTPPPRSNPINFRIQGLDGRPLFPDSAYPLPLRTPERPQTDTEVQAGPSNASNESDMKEQNSAPKFKDMIEMIQAHIEELKQRPPLDTPVADKEDKNGNDGGKASDSEREEGEISE